MLRFFCDFVDEIKSHLLCSTMLLYTTTEHNDAKAAVYSFISKTIFKELKSCRELSSLVISIMIWFDFDHSREGYQRRQKNG